MDQLAPWIDHHRTTRRPVVALDKLDLFHYAKKDDVDEQSTRYPQAAILQLLADNHHAVSAMPTWPVPTFAITALAIEGQINTKTAPEVCELIHQLNEHNVEITIDFCGSRPVTALSVSALLKHLSRASVKRAALAAVVHAVVPPPGSGHLSKYTSVDIGYVGHPSVHAFLSSLPYAKSVHTLDIMKWTYGTERIDHDMAWLAYVLFHPDTPSSSWKRLLFSPFVLSTRRIAILRAIAQGNNLAAFLGLDDEPNHRSNNHTMLGYCRATLALHVTVYAEPKTGLRKRVKAAHLLTTTNATTTVEVCGVSTNDHRQWDKWVPVVVPGYGLGWVRSADVTFAEMRPPADATLTSFCFSGSTNGCVDDKALYSFFQLIGQQLVHLEMSCGDDIDLRLVLINCPSLESLAIPYQSAMWSDSTVSSLLPRLRELELTHKSLEGETMAVTQFPRSLQVLRIIASGRQNPHAYDGIVRQLRSSASALRVFHWQEGLSASLDPTPYTETCADTERRLDTVGVPRAWRHAVLSRLRPSCAAAFLSVAEAQRLDPEVAQIIVAFAGHCGRRSIVLEPQASEIPEERRQSYPLPV